MTTKEVEEQEEAEVGCDFCDECPRTDDAKGQNYAKIGKYLIDNKLPELNQLTKREAMDLIDSLKGAK